MPSIAVDPEINCRIKALKAYSASVALPNLDMKSMMKVDLDCVERIPMSGQKLAFGNN